MLTVHTIIKNEEKWIEFALRSVIEYVDKILVLDTGSTDGTVELVEQLCGEYPGKVVFEKKGPADKVRHTLLRQEMLERTETEWFMILDGDEVWTRRGIEEVKEKISLSHEVDCFIAPFYLCVGDVFHHSRRGQFTIQGKTTHATARIFRKTPGLSWVGAYGADAVENSDGKKIAESNKAIFLQQKFWHLTHLERSLINEYSSGGTRIDKRVPTYFLIGKKIREAVPEVFIGKKLALNPFKSFIQFWPFAVNRLLKKIKL